jgi:hypothetical protein
MMKQTSFSDAEFASDKKLTRREHFLAAIERAAPWPALIAALLPCDSKSEGRDRPPVGLERMLPMYIAKQCPRLSDEGVEDASDDNDLVRGLTGVDLTQETARDATTSLKFRRLLEENNLTRRVLDEINGLLADKGRGREGQAWPSPGEVPVQASRDPLPRPGQRQRAVLQAVRPGQSGLLPQVLGQRSRPDCALQFEERRGRQDTPIPPLLNPPHTCLERRVHSTCSRSQ